MTISAILGVFTLVAIGVTIILFLRKMHGRAGIMAIFTMALSFGQAFAYMATPYYPLEVLFELSAIFFAVQATIELRAYRNELHTTYFHWKDIPVGLSYVQNPDGTYRIISDEEAKKMRTGNISVHTNILFKQTTRRFASEADKQKYLEQHNMNKYPRLNETTVNAICNMFRSDAHTIGYDRQTPLGRIAWVAYINWHCRGQKYPEWHMAEYEQPSDKDLTEHDEILVLATDGTYHICNPDNKITRDDGTVEWFNGDVFIQPYLWMVIPIAVEKWNVTKFPNIPLDTETRDRKF